MITLGNYSGVTARWQHKKSLQLNVCCKNMDTEIQSLLSVPLICILYQISHTHKQTHLIVSRQLQVHLALTLLNIHGSICTYSSQTHWKCTYLTHTQAHKLSHTHTVLVCASFLPLHADCVSGTGVKVWNHTQAVCSVWLLHPLNGLYEWLGLND